MTRPARVLIGNTHALLAATECLDVETLSGLVDADCEPDVWVAESDDGVEIGSGIWAICLAFPFAIAEFWAVVDEVERAETTRIEDEHR